MSKNKSFNIAVPNVRTIYLGKNPKQRVMFIELQEIRGQETLEEDIKTGAVIYQPFLEELKHKTTKYNIITAPTEEDGLRAVQYLADIHASQKGYESDPDTDYKLGGS